LLKQIVLVLIITALAAVTSGQTAQPALPSEPGMYIENSGDFTKIIGQIAEFKRSGSALVSHATAGIKSQKENTQLLGAHAQTVASSQPVFYFIPAKQEADAGVNAGDLILIRLEEKSERRQFEIAAHGAWRSSLGISLTHQVQIFRSEVKPGIYKIAPATGLGRGEYALYLSRGEGMAAYVYDFSVQDATSARMIQRTNERSSNVAEVQSPAAAKSSPGVTAASSQRFTESSIGVFSDVNPNVRRDGITLAAVTPGGPADQVGIKAGDVILAINDHYLFTAGELTDEVSHHQPGTKIVVRYRRYSTIYDASLFVGQNR
jgi:PDZ domain